MYKYLCEECYNPLYISLFIYEKEIFMKLKCQNCKYLKTKNFINFIFMKKTSSIMCSKCGSRNNKLLKNPKEKKISCEECKGNDYHHLHLNYCKVCNKNKIKNFCISCEEYFCDSYCINNHMKIYSNINNQIKEFLGNKIENYKIKENINIYEKYKNDLKKYITNVISYFETNEKNDKIIYSKISDFINLLKFIDIHFSKENSLKNSIFFTQKESEIKLFEIITLLRNENNNNYLISAIPMNENIYCLVNFSEIKLYKNSNLYQTLQFENLEILTLLYYIHIEDSIKKEKILISLKENLIFFEKDQENNFKEIKKIPLKHNFTKIIQYFKNGEGQEKFFGISNETVYSIEEFEHFSINKITDITDISDITDIIQINNEILIMSSPSLNKLIILYYNNNDKIKEYFGIDLSYEDSLSFIRDNIIVVKGNKSLSIFDCINLTILRTIKLDFNIFSFVSVSTQIFITITKENIILWDCDLNIKYQIKNEMEIFKIKKNIINDEGEFNESINGEIIGVGKLGIYKFNFKY